MALFLDPGAFAAGWVRSILQQGGRNAAAVLIKARWAEHIIQSRVPESRLHKRRLPQSRLGFYACKSPASQVAVNQIWPHPRGTSPCDRECRRGPEHKAHYDTRKWRATNHPVLRA